MRSTLLEGGLQQFEVLLESGLHQRLGGQAGIGRQPWTIAHLIWPPSYAALALGYIGVHSLIRAERGAAVLVVAAVAISGLEQAGEVPLRLLMAAAVILLWFAARPIADRMREPARTTA